MKVTKQVKEAVKDGSPFDIKMEVKGMTYLKLQQTEQQALYSIYDKKAEKLKGFAVLKLGGKIKKHEKLTPELLKQFES